MTIKDPGNPARRASQISMDCVMQRDRQGWLDNFTDDAHVEDPVGPSPLSEDGSGHRGHEAIGAFWDMTVATMESIEFEMHDSFANGNECVNVASIHLVMPGGVKARTDGVFHYVVNDEGKVTNLRAHWELERMMATMEQAAE